MRLINLSLYFSLISIIVGDLHLYNFAWQAMCKVAKCYSHNVDCLLFKILTVDYVLFVLNRINVRVEHVNHSKCRIDFLDRVKQNETLKREAKQKKIHVVCKRQVGLDGVCLVLLITCYKGCDTTSKIVFYISLFLFVFQPAQPRPAHFVSAKNAEPVLLQPVPYEFVA